MEYEQVKYTRFISPTTCYSGLRRFSKDSSIGSLATETDIITVDISNHAVGGVSLPRPTSMFSNLPCVGYDSLGEHEIWYYLQKKTNFSTEPTDASSVAGSSTNDGPSSTTSPPRYRNTSVKSSENSTASMAGSASLEESPVPQDTATLLLWKYGTANELSSSCLYVSKKIPSCRLLAPSLSKVTCVNDSEESNIYLVWTGCADDSMLRCFQLVTNSNSRPEIQAVSLENCSLETNFNSPIMALATSSCIEEKRDQDGRDKTKMLLSVGCQDGTVRIFDLSCRVTNENGRAGIINFDHSCCHTTIVDGPIMSIAHHVTNQVEQAFLIGSMCGYVCQLKQNNESGEWEAPTMVVKDYLWDARYNADDPVLAVCGWEGKNRVILGTFSGMVQVYVEIQEMCGEATKGQDTKHRKHNYMMEWSCRLPYPIHSIACQDDKYVVTTRRSLHIFHSRQIRRYSADRAKYRLKSFLNDRAQA